MTNIRPKLVLTLFGSVAMSAWSNNSTFDQNRSPFIGWVNGAEGITHPPKIVPFAFETKLPRPVCMTIASTTDAMVAQEEHRRVVDNCSEETERIAESMLEIICGEGNGVMALFCNADGSIDKERSQARCGRPPDTITKVMIKT